MDDLTDIIPLVASRVDGAPIEIVHEALRRAWREFCQKTEAWRILFQSSLYNKPSVFQIIVPQDTYLVRVVRVYVERDNSGEIDIHPDAYSVGGPITAPELTLKVDLGETGTLCAVAVVCPMPSLQDPPVNPSLLMQFSDGIADGAAAYLLQQTGKPWTDANQARLARESFLNAIAAAKSEIVKERKNTRVAFL